MKRFSDFGIDVFENKNIFSVPQISIAEIINCEVEVIDFEPDVVTRHGDGRFIVKIRHDGSEKKFFTNANPIKDALKRVSKSDFPFIATIKQKRYGTGSNSTFYIE